MSGEAAPVSDAEMAEADIRVNEVEVNADVQFEPLFDEDVSDAELQGEPEETTDEKKSAESEPKGEGEKPAEETKEETAEEKEAREAEEAKAAAEAEKAEKTDAEPEEVDYSKPPPKGYVAIPALQEARREYDGLKQQLEVANQTITAMQEHAKIEPKEEPEEDEFKDFKVLSDNELKELTEEDVEEAVLYMNKLNRFKDVQAERKQQQQLERYEQQRVETAVNKSVERIMAEVPGIYDEGSTIGSELYKFAVSNGFNEQFLSAMTAPNARITPVDESGKLSEKSYPLGDGAASLITMLHKLHQASKNGNPENLRSEIEAEIRKDEREKATKEITQELIEKFKSETTGQTFRSIGDGPGGSDDDPGKKNFYSESDFANMSPEEEKRILGG